VWWTDFHDRRWPSPTVTATLPPRPRARSERRIERQRHLLVVMLPLGEVLVIAVHLAEVVILEGDEELFEEVLEGYDGLVGEFGEVEAIGIGAHVSALPPQRA